MEWKKVKPISILPTHSPNPWGPDRVGLFPLTRPLTEISASRRPNKVFIWRTFGLGERGAQCHPGLDPLAACG